MRRAIAPLLGLALVVGGVTAVTADAAPRRVAVRDIPVFTSVRDTVPLAADGRGAVGIVALAKDPVGPGTEYEALRIMGVPAQVTTIDDDLSRFRVVILAGTADAASIGQDAADRLSKFVEGGGALIAEAATAPALRPLLGIGAVAESQKREKLLLCAACDPTLSEVTGKTERAIELDDVQSGTGIGTVGYRPTGDTTVLGTFDDGWAAVLAHPVGAGVAYTVGARLSDLITRHWEGSRFSAKRGYVNSPEADADAWLQWLRGVWRVASPGGVTLSTLPAGVTTPVIMTISANWGAGITGTPAYLKTIRATDPDARTTVFVATHTRRDWLDAGYFATPRQLLPDPVGDALEQATALGAELASHSVSHSPVFNRLGVGTGRETWSNYQPFVANRKVTRGATVLGELLVSRALLLQFQSSVQSFRAPYLLTPRNLASAEDAVGYRYESSSTQGWTQTAFPFHPPRLDDAGFADVLTFPIAVEDEQSGRLGSRVGDAVRVIAANAANGAPSTVLIHPTDDGNREAVAKLLRELRGRFGKGLSVESVGSFGAFWSQREHLALSVAPASAKYCGADGGVRITVTNRGGERVARQALRVADGSLTRAEIDNGGNHSTVTVEDGVVRLPSIRANRTLTGTLCP